MSIEDSMLCNEIFVLLRRIIRTIELNSRQLVSQYGLTGPQLLILQELARLNEVSVGSLAKTISLSHATVTDILDRLEKRELIVRTRSTSDKRRVYVKITESGQGILEQAPPTLQENFRNEFQRLEEWEKTLLISSLQRIADMMEKHDTISQVLKEVESVNSIPPV